MLYCWPLGDWPLSPPEGADRPVFAPPDRAPFGARPSVDEARPALPWPEERWLTLAPVRVVLEPPTAVDVRLRTLVRVDTPLSTATPAKQRPTARGRTSDSRRGGPNRQARRHAGAK
jgi:hypothetical protein